MTLFQNCSLFGLISVGNRSEAKRVRSASHLDRISRRKVGKVRPHVGTVNNGYQSDEKSIFDLNLTRRDFNDNIGVSLNEVRKQMSEINSVQFDKKLQKGCG